MLVRIADLTVMAGDLAPAKRGSVLEWAAANQGAADLNGVVATGGMLQAIASRPNDFALIENGRAIVWHDEDGDDVDLCADALRLKAEQQAIRAAE